MQSHFPEEYNNGHPQSEMKGAREGEGICVSLNFLFLKAGFAITLCKISFNLTQKTGAFSSFNEKEMQSVLSMSSLAKKEIALREIKL